jgi:hypothetical protein
MLSRKTPWFYWFPDQGETEEDRREWDDIEDRDVGLAAQDIAEQKWRRDSRDRFDEITLAIIDPHGEWHTAHVTVEQVPAFRATHERIRRVNTIQTVNEVFAAVMAELACAEAIDVDKLDTSTLNLVRNTIGVVLGVRELVPPPESTERKP